MNDQIKFSIITVCKNPGKNLLLTLENLRQQVYPHFELIVIDGGSTDGSIGELWKYQQLVTKIVSEPDSGIYDAMNKGLALATGDYIYFLNAGDIFFDVTTLHKVAEFIKVKNPDLVYGDSWVVTPGTGIGFLRTHDAIDKVYLVTKTITHQSIFAKRGVFKDVGDFDTTFKIKADHDWIVRCWNKAKTFLYLPGPVVRYSNDGFSKIHQQKYSKVERKLFYKKNFSFVGILLFKAAYRLALLNGKPKFIRNFLNHVL